MTEGGMGGEKGDRRERRRRREGERNLAPTVISESRCLCTTPFYRFHPLLLIVVRQ